MQYTSSLLGVTTVFMRTLVDKFGVRLDFDFLCFFPALIISREISQDCEIPP